LSEWSDVSTDQNEDEPPFNTSFNAPEDEDAVFFTVKESRNKQIKIRKLEVSERGISIWDAESRTELEVFPFQKIKTFYYAPDGNFVVITVSTKAGSENIPWKTNKQAQQVKIAIEDTIAKLLKKKSKTLSKSDPQPSSESKMESNRSPKKVGGNNDIANLESEHKVSNVGNYTINTESSPSKRPTSLPVTQDVSFILSQPTLVSNEWNGNSITRSRSEGVVATATNESLIQIKPPPTNNNSKRKAVKILSMPDLISFE